ncbi:MAG: hypothetical protein AAGH90_05890 [Pseudomonadota bacterium]
MVIPVTFLVVLTDASIIALQNMNGINLLSMFAFLPDVALCLMLIGLFSALSATALVLNRMRS